MKEEVISEQPTTLHALQVQAINPTTDVADKSLLPEPVDKKLQVSKTINKTTVVPQSNAESVTLNSVENDECDVPKEQKNCTTTDGSIDVNMPATILNPFPSVATVAYTRTICFDAKGNATISYRNVEALPNQFPHPIFTNWGNLSSPTLDEAIDEYTIRAANIAENILTTQFLQDFPKVKILESRYYRGLCYTTCIFLKEGKPVTARTTCGDKCCKRVRIWSNTPNVPQLSQKYYETKGGVCAGSNQVPCVENVIVVTSVCSHDCEPRLD